MNRSPFTLILAFSFALNLALLALAITSARERATSLAASHATKNAHELAAAASGEKKIQSLLVALERGDSAALSAAGVSTEVVRHLVAARAFARLRALTREEETAPSTTEYWRTPRSQPKRPPTRDQRIERMAAERDFDQAMKEAFGRDWNDERRVDEHGFLSAEKQEKIRRIQHDYEEMEREVAADSEVIQLRADREKLKLLAAEKDRDLAAVLTDEEREQLELRTSASAQAVIHQFGDVIASEEEYRRLYALQKAFDDQFTSREGRPPTPAEVLAREDAQRKLNDAFRDAIGEERWAALPTDGDSDREMLAALTSRLGISPATADQVQALRDNFAGWSIAIQQKSGITEAERRAQLLELADRIAPELTRVLGSDGAETYLEQSSWVRILKGGSAFTTDPHQLPRGSPRPQGTAFPLSPANTPKG